MVRATAIVPMYNEEETCRAVLSVLVGSDFFEDVIAVDDGSRDSSCFEAAQAGAHVLRLPRNMGKGQAMRVALEHASSPWVGFFDADLVGFSPNHVARFFDGASLGYDMVCGLRDYGNVALRAQLLGPLITGERLCRRELLEAIPESCWQGYAIETAMNATADRLGLKTLLFVMDGVSIRTKLDKAGFWKGLHGQAKMFLGIRETKDRLRCSGGRSC